LSHWRGMNKKANCNKGKVLPLSLDHSSRARLFPFGTRLYVAREVFLFACAAVGLTVGLVTALLAGCQTLHGYGPAALIGIAGSGLGLAIGRALHVTGPHDNLGFVWALVGAGVIAALWCWVVRRSRLL
jgi:uncharacterized membrane protein YeaQ/YmgE (transglycosylase-associated protein family)